MTAKIRQLPEEKDPACLGLSSVLGHSGEPALVYDAEKVVEILMETSGIETYEDAWDYYYHNFEGAYLGTGTPCFVHKPLSGQSVSEMVSEVLL